MWWGYGGVITSPYPILQYFYDLIYGWIDRGICTYFSHAMAMGAMGGDAVLCDGSVDSSHDHSDQQFELGPAGFGGKT